MDSSTETASPPGFGRDSAETEASHIIWQARVLSERTECLTDYLQDQLDIEPNQRASWKYHAKFLDLEDFGHFRRDCKAFLPSEERRRISKRRQRDARKRQQGSQAFDLQEVQASASGVEDNTRPATVRQIYDGVS